MRDIHLHLSGATDPVLLFELIQEAGLKGAKDYWQFFKKVTADRSKVKDLDDYLEVLHIIDDAQSSPRAVELSVYNSYVNSYLNGCRYLELRWNPYKRSSKFKIDLDKLIISARAGYEKAKSTFGIDGGLMLCLGRDVSKEANEGIFKKAIKYHKKGVIGIDIAGPEKLQLHDEFQNYYVTANAMEMETTIHAGETDHEGVEDELAFVLEKYKPNRIGHGVQIHRFPKLMKIASKNGIHFEICITSNLTTKAVESKEKFAEIFRIFEDNKIDYSINTDATFALDTNIHKENELYKEIKLISQQ